ncbi:MAG: hypothetical protein ACI4SF_09275 [Oscillospiraceae bacterium]
MMKIARSILYGYGRQSIIRVIFIVMLLLMFSELLVFIQANDGNAFTMSEFAASYLQTMSTIAEMFIVINTCWVCTMDFGDKTANYELMTGHTRLDIYAARVAVSVITGVCGYFLLILSPVIAGCFIWSWGSCVYVSDMIFRWFMLIFPVVRIIVETAFFSFIVRKPAVVLIAGFIINEFFTIVPTNNEMVYTSCILGTSNLAKLTIVDARTTYGLSDGAMWLTFDTMLPKSYIASTVIAALIASVLFFYLGYTFFRYDDID